MAYILSRVGPGRPREAQRGPERLREAQGSPGRPRKTQGGPYMPREAQRVPGMPSEQALGLPCCLRWIALCCISVIFCVRTGSYFICSFACISRAARGSVHYISQGPHPLYLLYVGATLIIYNEPGAIPSILIICGGYTHYI